LEPPNVGLDFQMVFLELQSQNLLFGSLTADSVTDLLIR